MSQGVSPNMAWLAALGALDIKEPLVDQSKLGDFYVRVGVYISAGFSGGFPVGISLPRKPSFFFYTSDSGAVVYQNQADKTNSTPSTLYIRARQGTSDLISANVTLIVG